MDLNKLLPNPNEKPLDSFPEGISNTEYFAQLHLSGTVCHPANLNHATQKGNLTFTTCLNTLGDSTLPAKTD